MTVLSSAGPRTLSDGWTPICERLELPVPDEAFPVTNTTADFQAMLAAGGPPGLKS